jgi:crossover junction endodeoxyribonuclease RuvC
MRILGIDPGSRITGFGIIDVDKRQNHYIACGCIKAGDGDFPARIRAIAEGIVSLVNEYQPEQMAIERVFLNRNADSALKLGQARGAAIAAVVMQDIPVFEYSATQIKQASVGRGHADKTQVQHMVRALLQLTETPQADAADALACALCHSHHQQTQAMMPASAGPVLAVLAGRRRR